MSWITVDTDLPDHPKMAALPNDTARWGWVVTLCKAKQQRKPGTFANANHFRHVMGRYARFLEDYKKAGLLDKGEDDTLQVHDWRKHQWAVSKAQQRETSGGHSEDKNGTSRGRQEDVSRAVGVGVPVGVLETTEGVQGEPNDPWTMYRSLTRGSALNPNTISWLTRLEDEHGAVTVCAHLHAVWEEDPDPKTLLSRTEKHILDRRRKLEQDEAKRHRSTRITDQMQARRLELYRNTGKWDTAWGPPPVAVSR